MSPRRTRRAPRREATPPSPVPGARRSKRVTRQAAADAAAAAAAAAMPKPAAGASAAARGRRPDATPRGARPGSLVGGPIPRRGAPSHKMFDITSVNPRAGHASDEEYSDEPYESAEEPSEAERYPSEPPDSPEPAAADGDDLGDQEDIERRRQEMQELLPHLESAADDLTTTLLSKDRGGRVFDTILKARRDAFVLLRVSYPQPGVVSPFIDWHSSGDVAMGAATTLVKANLATALDDIQRLQGANHPAADTLAFLEALDAAAPDRITAPGRAGPSPQMILEIRTRHAIECLAACKGRAGARAAIARVFRGEGDDVDAEGPYRSLGGDEGLCAARVAHVLGRVAKSKSDLGVSRLRKEFPLDELLGALRDWVVTEYAELQNAPREVEHASNESEAAAWSESEAVADSDAESESSHEITRLTPSEERPTLFAGLTSLRQLEGAGAGRDGPPQAGPLQSGEPPGAPGKAEVPAPEPAAQAAGCHCLPSGADADDARSRSSSDFESDTRPAKRIAVRPSWRTRDFPRPAPERRRPPRAASAFVGGDGSAPSPSPSPSPSPPPAPAPAPAPAALPPTKPYTRRTPWSKSDTRLLVRLVGSHKTWADIERHHREDFECLRDQQAYRDKARNLKVELLTRDEPLPPAFDHVSLGKKEVDRLRRLGKNPYRRESDVDAHGRPTKTELVRDGLDGL